jgi:hypothetical protein
VLRYLAISTVIVVLVAAAVGAWVNRDLIRIKIASVYGEVASKAAPTVRLVPGSGGVRGDAPWALSVFPECLRQTSESTGPLDYVMAHLPAGVAEVRAPATLVYGDCTIVLADGAASVRRGTDNLRIPPHVTLYRGRNVLVLLRRSSRGNDLRVYEVPHR